MIENNRVARILHKDNFLARQRAAIDHSHKFVITDEDVAKSHEKASNEKIVESAEVRQAKIINGFDPENNEQDRRILYEVLGMRIYSHEFLDEGSSSDFTQNEEEEEPMLQINSSALESYLN